MVDSAAVVTGTVVSETVVVASAVVVVVAAVVVVVAAVVVVGASASPTLTTRKFDSSSKPDGYKVSVLDLPFSL